MNLFKSVPRSQSKPFQLPNHPRGKQLRCSSYPRWHQWFAVKCVCVCVCVCVCLCVSVCVCVCVYTLPPWSFIPSARCLRHTEGYASLMLCCEYHSRCFCQVHSSPYLKMSYFTSSKDKTPPRRETGEKRYDIFGSWKYNIYWYYILI